MVWETVCETAIDTHRCLKAGLDYSASSICARSEPYGTGCGWNAKQRLDVALNRDDFDSTAGK